MVTKAQAVLNPALNGGHTVICRGVIDNDELETLLGLNPDAFKRFGDALGVVVETDNYRCQGRPLGQIDSVPLTHDLQWWHGAILRQGHQRFADMASSKLC